MSDRRDFYKKKHAAIGSSTWKKIPWAKLPAGESTIRIIPPYNAKSPGEYPAIDPNDDATWFFREYRKIDKLGPNGKSVIPRYQFGDPDCPYKRYIDDLKRKSVAGDAVAQSTLDGISERDKVGMWIIIRGKEAEGPFYWETTQNNLKQILAIAGDDEFGDVDRAVPDADGKGAIDLKVVFNRGAIPAKMWQITAKRNSSPLLPDPQAMRDLLLRNLWDEYGAAKPHDADYIQAVIEGRENDGDKSEPDAPNANAPDAPVPPPVPPTPPVTKKVTYPFAADSKWWAFLSGNTVQTTALQIAAAVEAGDDPQIMPTDQSRDWGKASTFGFQLEIQAPPPPPAPPSAPPAPPAPPTEAQHPVPPSEADALKAQIAALKQQAEVAPPSPVDEIEALLTQGGKK